MKFSLALAVAIMAHMTSATFGHYKPNPPYCGVTTITEQCKTATKTSYSHFPTVTETVTKKKNVCETKITKTTTDTHTVFSETKVFVTPTILTTVFAPKVTETKTKTTKVTGCPQQKRHFVEERTAEAEVEDDEEVEFEEDEYAGLTNAERIRRGLPLAKPIDKRTWCKDGKCGPKPPQAGPSCVPSTKKIEVTKTVTKSVTPTKYVTTTKCGHTQTYATTVCVTTETTKVKTKTKTANPTTVKTTVTPTKTSTVHATITVPPKGGCQKGSGISGSGSAAPLGS